MAWRLFSWTLQDFISAPDAQYHALGPNKMYFSVLSHNTTLTIVSRLLQLDCVPACRTTVTVLSPVCSWFMCQGHSVSTLTSALT